MCSRCLDSNISFLGAAFQALFRRPIGHDHSGPLLIDSLQADEAIFDYAFAQAVKAGQLSYHVVKGTREEPFGPWRSLIGGLSAEIDGLGDTERRVLSNLLHGRDAGLPMLTTHHALYRTFDGIRQLLAQASNKCPQAILIHRLDQSDDASLRLLRFLSPFLADMRLFVAATVDSSDDGCASRIKTFFPRSSVNVIVSSGETTSGISSFRSPQLPVAAHPVISAETASAEQWIDASTWTRSIGAAEFAAQYLRKALTLAADAELEWNILIDLIKIHAETGQIDEAEKCLAMWLQHNKTRQCDNDDLSNLALAFSDAGLERSQLAPLIDRLTGSTDDLTWARVELLEPPRIVSVASGRVTQGRWLGANQKATRIVRERGNEDDLARTLYVYDWWSKSELDALLMKSRDWKGLSGRSRALSVAAETLMYRYGEFARACSLLEEQVHMHVQTGWIEEKAKSLVRLSMALLANGELDRADETRVRARETVWRLGPDYLIYEHAGTKSGGDLYPEISMESNFAWYREGDWLAVAEHWAMAVAMHEGAGSPVHTVEAAMAAQAYARLDRFDDARVYLDELMAILPKLEPRDWAFNGAVGRASHAIWDMLDQKYAEAFLGFSEALLADGVGDWTNTSLELSAARMAALLDKPALATEYFSKARQGLNELQAPQRGIVDYDEAIALRLAGDPEPERRRGLLASATQCFAANGMSGWQKRAEREAGA